MNKLDGEKNEFSSAIKSEENKSTMAKTDMKMNSSISDGVVM